MYNILMMFIDNWVKKIAKFVHNKIIKITSLFRVVVFLQKVFFSIRLIGYSRGLVPMTI